MILYARAAADSLRHTETATENIALMPVILRLVSKAVTAVSNKEFEAERKYQMSVAFAKNMFRNGIITEEEFTQIDTKLLLKYRPILSTLLSGKALIK